MKKELIKTENYLLVVDDAVIKDVRLYKGKWHLEKGYILNKFPVYLTDLSDCKIIIAHLPLNNSPILEGVPLLRPLEVEDDVEKLNEDLFDKGSDNILHPQYQMRTFFNMGYSKAKEKYKFTEDNIAKAVMFGRWGETTKKAYQDFIESLSQPKTPTHFEFETEITHENYEEAESACFVKIIEIVEQQKQK